MKVYIIPVVLILIVLATAIITAETTGKVVSVNEPETIACCTIGNETCYATGMFTFARRVFVHSSTTFHTST